MNKQWILNRLICGVALGCLSACSPQEPGPTLTSGSDESETLGEAEVSVATPAPSTQPGLYVEDGTLMRNGEEFRAMGINYCSALHDVLKDPETLEVAEGFRILKQDYGIPFVRLNGGPYAHTQWKMYVEDPEEYLRRFDVLVKHAEEQGIGLIPSFFWAYFTMPDLQGEPVSALGDPDSQCRAFMRQYVRELVGRYKDSPAIWGWEFGNEYILNSDLPGHLPPQKIGSEEERTAEDRLHRPMVLDACKDFYKTVREIDPDRIIVTGDSITCSYSWHQRHEDKWVKDSKEQWTEMFRADTPDDYEVASIHLYEEHNKMFFKKSDLSIEAFLQELVGISRADNKIIWCGELGMPGVDEAASDMFFRMMHAVEENEIAISAIWNFKPQGTFQADWDISPTNERAYMLDAVKELNGRFSRGLGNAE